MASWASIVYREFFDVPRSIVARNESGTYLFWSRFVDDHYQEFYDVYLMPPLYHKELRGSWIGLEKRAIQHLGTIPTRSLAFDDKRSAVDLAVLDKLQGKT